MKNSERNLKDSVAYIEEQLRESENTIAGIKAQLEESEWKVCERNGELALLKSQLKEANVSKFSSKVNFINKTFSLIMTNILKIIPTC